jgi:hypothetical protein
VTTFKWVVSPEDPHGHLEEFTADEETQRIADLSDWTADAEVQAVAHTNAETMRGHLQDDRAELITLAQAIEDETASEAEQRQALVLCLRGIARITRLELSHLDEAD